MELTEQVKNAVDKAISGGDVEQAITDAVTNTVKKSIADHLRSYSDFGKTVDEAVKNALRFEPINLPSYNDLIVKMVRKAVKDHADRAIAAQVEKQIEDLFEPPPKELLLSDLVEQYVKRIRDANEGGCVCYGEEYAKVEFGEYSTDSFVYVKLFESSSDRDEEIYIGVHLHRDEKHELQQRGHIYHLRFKDKDLENKMFVDGMFGLERMLFQMKAEQCVLVLDCDPSGMDLDTAPQH